MSRPAGLDEPAAGFEIGPPAQERSAPAGEVGAERQLSRDIAAMTFEEALAELESIVQKLERGQLDLEAAIGAFERGTELRQHCTAKLREAELRVEKLSFDRSGTPRTTPFEGS